MKDHKAPTNRDDYLKLFNANQAISGYGSDVAMHMPCPWCAAPDFAKWRIIDSERLMQQPSTCGECGRTGHIVFTMNEPGHKAFEFVQTAGPDAPEWLTPPPRRVNDETDPSQPAVADPEGA